MYWKNKGTTVLCFCYVFITQNKGVLRGIRVHKKEGGFVSMKKNIGRKSVHSAY